MVSLYGVLDRISWLEDGFLSARLFLEAYAGSAALDKAFKPPIPITPMDIARVEKIPPTFLAVGSKDALARSSRIYAEHLLAHFKDVKYTVYEGATHGFYCFSGLHGDALRKDVATFLASVESRNP